MGNQKTLKDLGIVSPVPMGDWTIATQYTILNIVRYNGGVYIAKQANKGVEPTVTTNWQNSWMFLMGRSDIATTAVNNISYDNNTQSLTVSYTDGTSESVSLSALISGLQAEINENNKLNADLVNDTNSANKFVTASEKAQITTNRNDIQTLKTTVGDNSSGLVKAVNDNTTEIARIDADYGRYISLLINSSTYVLTVSLYNNDSGLLDSSQVDLPLESMVVSGSYDSTTKSLVLTLQSGSTITIPVGDLISGLVPDSRTVNGHALSSDVTVTKSDIDLGNVDNVLQYSANNPNFGSSNPLMDGTASTGSATTYSRSDHVHPSDTIKADKVSGATDGDFAALDANGNLTDSGKSASDFSKVSVSATGSATDEIKYITVDGIEKKIAGGDSNAPFTLIKRYVTGYSVLTTEPADWSTNYTDYYQNTGTADLPVYENLTEQVEFVANTYYEYNSAVASVKPSKITFSGTIKGIYIKAKTKDTNTSDFWLRPIIKFTPLPSEISMVLKYAGAFTTAQDYIMYITYFGDLHWIQECIVKRDELFTIKNSKIELSDLAYGGTREYATITNISELSFNAGNCPGNVTIEVYIR